MRRLVFATVMLLMFTGIIFGQSTPLTVEECIQIALRDNSTIRINRNLNESTSEDVTGSYAGILPTINITASTGKAKAGDRETEQDVPIGVRPDSSYIYGRRVITQPGYETNFNNFGLSVSQNVFDGGEWWNAISYAKSEKNVSDKTLHSTVSNVVLDVEQKFYDLLKAQKLLEVNNLAVQRSEDQLNKTQKMFELGAVAKVDVYRSKVNLGNDRINQLLQKNAVVAARQNLNLAMGRDPKTQVEIKTDIEIKGEYSEVDSLISRGLAYNPEIQKNEATVNSNSLQVSRSYGVLWPALRLFFNYNRSNEAFNRVWSYSGLDKNWGTNYGVNLSLNLFNGLRDKTRIQKAKLQERNAQETYEQSKRSLRSKINQLVVDYNSYLEIIIINEENLEAAQEEYRLAEERYRIGSGTQLEVREAQVNLNRAEVTLVQAKYSALVAQAQMENALGIVTAEMAGGNE